MKQCSCGFPLKKEHHIRCYRCQLLKKKNGYSKWMSRRKAKSFRYKKFRQKQEWFKKVQRVSSELSKDFQICDYQPDYPFGIVNTCKCPCNGDC